MVRILDRFMAQQGEGAIVEASKIAEQTGEEKRVIGKIIKVAKDDGWGFISSKDIKFTRIFFHWTSLKQNTLKFQDLRNGMKVEFTPVEVPEKGVRAIKIVVIQDESKNNQV